MKKTHQCRSTYSRVNNVLVSVEGILADPEPGALDKDGSSRLGSRFGAAIPLLDKVELGLDAKDGLFYTSALDRLARVVGGEAADAPLVGAKRGVDAGRVGGLEKGLGDDVDDALLGVEQVAQGVLGVGDAAGEANHEGRRVVGDDVEVAKRREVGGAAVGAAGAHKGNGPRGDGGDEQLVVGRRGAVGGVRVNGDVRAAGAGVGEGVGALAKLPVRVGGFGVVEALVRLPVRAGGHDFFKVGMWVAVDAVGHCEGEVPVGDVRGRETAPVTGWEGRSEANGVHIDAEIVVDETGCGAGFIPRFLRKNL